MNNKLKIKITSGPSLYSNSKSVLFDYDQATFGNGFEISANEIQKLHKILPKPLSDKLVNNEKNNVHDLLVSLVNVFFQFQKHQNMNTNVQHLKSGVNRLVAEYDNALAMKNAVETAVLIMQFIKSDIETPPVPFVTKINELSQFLIYWSPSELTQKFRNAAKRKNIPFLLLLETTPFTVFGQGIHSKIFDYGLTELDSQIGYRLQDSKSLTVNVLQRIGYPTPEQAVVKNFQMCVDAIRQINFPVVIKPLSEGMGNGVTANIQTLEQARDAFSLASKLSSDGVVVEKHIDGDLYRITLSKNKILGVDICAGAKVFGDGISTVKELIDVENRRRKELKNAKFLLKDIQFDERVTRNLRNANLNGNSIPDKGQEVLLTDIVNRHAGGTKEPINIEDMHPDTVEMAEDICKTFRLDSVGIDMISTDISKSWRDNGAIIEVNAYPGSVLAFGDRIMENYFGETQGRIDTTLFIADHHEIALNYYKSNLEKHDKCGFACHEFAMFESGRLSQLHDTLANNCQTLVLNKSCDAIVVSLRADDLMKTGLPLDYFDRCIVDKNVNYDDVIAEYTDHKNLESWLSQFCGKVEHQ
ncbi:hypothetical protein [Pseudemcibacter aquimaris]|uniref:ATP-binding protein n=1 Tax=Pseudemcibacter aquimaris TaxID=2857064 RepID=UPI002013A42A|nr:hypothetical protein [Pseudemcibacter aquimaris]MCC3861326.1 hypothetical protein [Pseudemcibacter aquimaris]WDU58098.1 hypothetical protein KW060_12950 [Pseudemcibacter aquimaris]